MLQELLARLGSSLRWAPGELQLADAMTKDKAEAQDALRAALRARSFCLGDEAHALRRRSAEKEARLQRGRDRAAAAAVSRAVPAGQTRGGTSSPSSSSGDPMPVQEPPRTASDAPSSTHPSAE